MSTTAFAPCDVTKRALAMGHESTCGCPECNRAEFAKRLAWQQKHGTLDGYSPLSGTSDTAPATPAETHAHLVAPIEMKATDDGIVEGYASVFGERDSHDDIVAAGAFARSLRARQPAMLWQHRYDAPVGIWSVAHEDTHGLFVKGQLTLASQAGRDAYELVASGACTGLSIGFRTVKSTFDNVAKVRKLLDVDLFEVSFVTFPALTSARIRTVKGVVPPTTATSLHAVLDQIALSARGLSAAMERRTHTLCRDAAGLQIAVRDATRRARAARRVTRAQSPADDAKTREAANAAARAWAWQQTQSW